MPNSPTPNMGLTPPTVSGDFNEWGGELNNDLSIVDGHTHQVGSGVPIQPLGLNINSDLPIQSNNLNQVRSVRLITNGGTLAGAGDIQNVYSFGGNLYYNNGAGVPVQITNGTVVNSSATASTIFPQTGVSSNYTILSSSTFIELLVQTTSGSWTITMPAANSVAAGRYFIVKDVTGNAVTHNITIAAAGTDTIDTKASVSLVYNFQDTFIVSDGSSNWNLVGKSKTAYSAGEIQTFNTGSSSVYNTGSSLIVNGDGYINSGGALIVQSGGNYTGASGSTTTVASGGQFQALGSGANNIINIGNDGYIYLNNGSCLNFGFGHVIKGQIDWDSSTVDPELYQNPTSTAAGNNMYIHAQNTSFSGAQGGNLYLQGGTFPTNGSPGAVCLQPPSAQVAGSQTGTLVVYPFLYTQAPNTQRQINAIYPATCRTTYGGSNVTFLTIIMANSSACFINIKWIARGTTVTTYAVGGEGGIFASCSSAGATNGAANPYVYNSSFNGSQITATYTTNTITLAAVPTSESDTLDWTIICNVVYE